MTINKQEFLKAASKGDLAVINTYIMENENNPNALNVQNEKGQTAVYLAVSGRKKDCLERLIKAGADVNICQKYDSYTPLINAAADGWIEGVKLLIDGKADVNKVSARNKTPCHWAVCNADNEKILKMLLEAGADTSIKDYFGYTPIGIAMGEARPRCVLLLLLEGVEIPKADNNLFHSNYQYCQEKAKAPRESNDYKFTFGHRDPNETLANFEKVEKILLQKTGFQNVAPNYDTLLSLAEKGLQSKQETNLKEQVNRLTEQVTILTEQVKTLQEVINHKKESNDNQKQSFLPRLFN